LREIPVSADGEELRRGWRGVPLDIGLAVGAALSLTRFGAAHGGCSRSNVVRGKIRMQVHVDDWRLLLGQKRRRSAVRGGEGDDEVTNGSSD
jgi:hypothetical protein